MLLATVVPGVAGGGVAVAAPLAGNGALAGTVAGNVPVTALLGGAGILSAAVTGSGAPPAGPTYGSTGAGKTNNASGLYSWQHTIVGNAIVAFMITYKASAPSVIATCGGAGMTTLTYSAATGANFTYITVCALLNPPTGLQTINVVSDGTFNSGNSVSYNNVGSFGTPVLLKGASGTAMSAPVPTTAAQMVAQAFTGYSNASWSGYNKTARYSDGYEAGGNMALHIGDAVGDSALTFTITPSSNVLWSSLAVPINGVA